MSRTIVKLGGHYLIWSTIADAPITYGMKLEELIDYIGKKHGDEGLRDLPNRLKRVEATGTSAHFGESAVDTIWFNRAGPKEGALTIEGIYRHFCLQEPVEEAWIIPQEIADRDDGGLALYAAITKSWMKREMED